MSRAFSTPAAEARNIRRQLTELHERITASQAAFPGAERPELVARLRDLEGSLSRVRCPGRVPATPPARGERSARCAACGRMARLTWTRRWGNLLGLHRIYRFQYLRAHTAARSLTSQEARSAM